MRYVAFILFFVILLSCHSKQETIIPRKALVDLLVDLHLADAIATNTMVRRQFGELDSALIYKTVFDKHGYTRADMSRSIAYYSTETKKIVPIYDEVHARLSAQSEEMQELIQKITLSATYRVWRSEENRYRIKGDTVSYLEPFDFKVDTTGRFVIDVEIRIDDEEDQSVNPRMVAYFYNPIKDRPQDRVYFDTAVLNKSKTLRAYTLIVENRDTLLNRLRLQIPVQDNKDKVFMKDIEIRNLQLSVINVDKE